jgi:hypothetical protein
MDNIKKMLAELNKVTNRSNEIVGELSDKISNMSLETNKTISDLQEENRDLKNQLQKRNQENETLKKELEIKTHDIVQKSDEITNLTKVSMIHIINKQLDEKTNYIKILEGQLERIKNKQKEGSESEEVETTVVQEVEEPIKEKEKEKKKKKTSENLEIQPFDPDTFEEVNGFELLLYKKNYYLRDLETSEVYSIVNNNPDKVVGLMNGNGKIKLH